MKNKYWFTVILAVILLSTSLPIPPGAQGQSFDPALPGQPVLARVDFDGRQELDHLAADLDVWETHPEAGYLLAQLRPGQAAALAAQGFRVQVIRPLGPGQTYPDGASATLGEGASSLSQSGFACYRTIADLERDLQAIASSNPSLAELRTIGLSSEGRPLLVLRLTNRDTAGDKPVLFLLANVHGREFITPETAMAFVDTLLGGYGQDADITWLLDYHEIQVLVSANPDGHVKNEANISQVFWRKNTQAYGTCPPEFFGVDLNRNYAPSWGCCGGSSDDACSEIYRGPEADSEVETQAVQGYLRGLFPDQRGPGAGDPAPSEATGLVISLHSYGDMVLWPWGWTQAPAPNARELAVLGEKLAAYNQYLAIQSSGLYLADGTLDDWVYGELGVAAYTFEIGSNEDGFYPDCGRLPDLVQPDVSALLYAAKVASAPYRTAQGPDVVDLAISSPPAPGGDPLLTAWVAAGGQDGAVVAAVEAALDAPPWAGGAPIPMQPVDGAFDQEREAAEVVLAPEFLSEGRHILFVRGQDRAGVWGPVSAVFYTPGAGPFSAFLPILISGFQGPMDGLPGSK